MNNSCIVVLYFNKTNLTIKCIRSIIDSGYNQESILAFDNGSLIENYKIIKNRFPEIRHFRQDLNKGYSGGFNGAIKWAIREGFTDFLFCTNDTIVYPDTLNCCITANSKYNIEFIAPRIVYSCNPDEIDSIGGNFDFNTFTLSHYKKNDLPIELNPEFDYVPGTSFWLTKDVFEKLGGMDESFHTYWEDVDFSFRAHKKGIKAIRCYAALVGHEVGKTCHKKSLYSTFYFQRNRIRFSRIHCSKNQFANAKQIIKNDLAGFEIKWKNSNDIVRLGYLKELYEELEL